jgi:hypothetical protein
MALLVGVERVITRSFNRVLNLATGAKSAPLLIMPLIMALAMTAPVTASGETIASNWRPSSGILLAQADGDDAYDPFADYSEFEESAEEEEDINFFRNGRLLTTGFIGGYRTWTGNLGSLYTGNATFGLFISYFFDLRFALQFGFLTSDHMYQFTGGQGPIQGNVALADLSFNLKYFFNTQNVTRGLADLNPFLLAGFSQIYRTQTKSGIDVFAKDSAFAFNLGAGIEIPMMRNKMFFGGQALYQYIAFPDEAMEYLDDDDNRTGVYPRGDSLLFLGIMGVNF